MHSGRLIYFYDYLIEIGISVPEMVTCVYLF